MGLNDDFGVSENQCRNRCRKKVQITLISWDLRPDLGKISLFSKSR